MTTDNKVGRPMIELTDADFDKITEMAKICCTQDEICSIFGFSEDTLDRRLKDRGFANFADFYKKYAGIGKQSLRRIQWQSAQEGSVPMQIWLGKQWLGQADKAQTISTHTVTQFEVVPDEDTGESY
mgnify:CR=1 FL=1